MNSDSLLTQPPAERSPAAIAAEFTLPGPVTGISELTAGLINSTYRVESTAPDGTRHEFVLQSINPRVFPEPQRVMQNIAAVLSHLKTHGYSSPRMLELVPARADGNFWMTHASTCWRCWKWIESSICHEVVATPALAWQAAHAFGSFHHDLRDFPAQSLHPTIPDFHHTPRRLTRLLDSARADLHQRLDLARPEFQTILERKSLAHTLQSAIDSGKIPLRTTHNDTKISNVLFCSRSNDALCVIDLDTLMPGSVLHDFGDLARTTLSPAAEDDAANFSLETRLPWFESLVDGYLTAAGNLVSPAEIALLADSALVITLELAMRFLTDFLDGDLYFKTHHPNHNLHRCRNQLTLLREMECHLPSLRRFGKK